MTLLLRRARRYGEASLVDIRIDDGRITDVTDVTGAAESDAATPADVVDLDGRYVGPGLWDSHVHMTQWVAARRRFDVSGAGSAADAADLVAARLASSPAGRADALVGFGFRDALWPDAPTRELLDRVAGDVPVVLISGDLHCGWFNSAAGVAYRANVPASGLVRETEFLGGALQRIDAATKPGVDAFGEAADAAAARGVVGIVDLENDDNIAHWPQRVAAGVTALRIEASIWPWQLDDVIRAGRRSGDVLDEAGLVRVGPLKVIVDGSLNTRTAYCWNPYPGTATYGTQTVGNDELRRLLRTAADHGITAAVHAIGDRANTDVLDAYEDVGMGGTVEHAQQVRAADLPRFARLGVIASIQPEHAMDDRDVVDRHWAGHDALPFAFGSLAAAGAELRLGSDAPVAPLDPWVAIAAAVQRHRDGRPPWRPEERIPVEVALAASSRGRAGLSIGDQADLVIVEADPTTADDRTLRDMPVAGTLLGGRWTWSSR